MASHIERRKFLATLGGAVAWPLAASATNKTPPVIGVLWHAGSAEEEAPYLSARGGPRIGS